MALPTIDAEAGPDREVIAGKDEIARRSARAPHARPPRGPAIPRGNPPDAVSPCDRCGRYRMRVRFGDGLALCVPCVGDELRELRARAAEPDRGARENAADLYDLVKEREQLRRDLAQARADAIDLHQRIWDLGAKLSVAKDPALISRVCERDPSGVFVSQYRFDAAEQLTATSAPVLHGREVEHAAPIADAQSGTHAQSAEPLSAMDVALAGVNATDGSTTYALFREPLDALLRLVRQLEARPDLRSYAVDMTEIVGRFEQVGASAIEGVDRG
jgi:hypothetical protein